MKGKRIPFNFYLFLFLFIVFLMLTLFFIFFDTDRRIERVLYFPDESGLELDGELRRLPVRSDKAGNIELFVKEQMLGPASLDLYRLFPREVKLEALLLDKDVLYLSFSENLVTMAEMVPMSLPDIIDSIEKAVVFNFPGIKEVKAAIGGEPMSCK